MQKDSKSATFQLLREYLNAELVKQLTNAIEAEFCGLLLFEVFVQNKVKQNRKISESESCFGIQNRGFL